MFASLSTLIVHSTCIYIVTITWTDVGSHPLLLVLCVMQFETVFKQNTRWILDTLWLQVKSVNLLRVAQIEAKARPSDENHKHHLLKWVFENAFTSFILWLFDLNWPVGYHHTVFIYLFNILHSVRSLWKSLISSSPLTNWRHQWEPYD